MKQKKKPIVRKVDWRNTTNREIVSNVYRSARNEFSLFRLKLRSYAAETSSRSSPAQLASKQAGAHELTDTHSFDDGKSSLCIWKTNRAPGYTAEGGLLLRRRWSCLIAGSSQSIANHYRMREGMRVGDQLCVSRYPARKEDVLFSYLRLDLKLERSFGIGKLLRCWCLCVCRLQIISWKVETRFTLFRVGVLSRFLEIQWMQSSCIINAIGSSYQCSEKTY